MADDLQFDDVDIDELRGVDSLYLGDVSKFKKNDDLRRTSSPIGVLPPDPFPEKQPPPRQYRRQQQQQHHPQSVPHHNDSGSRLCKIFALLGFVACTLFLFGLIVFSALDGFKHSDHDKHKDGHGIHTVALPNQGGTALVLADAPEHNFEFTTTETIQSYVAYDLSTEYPQLDFSSLSNYRICCWSKNDKFICGSGYTFSNGLALDGYLAKEDETHISLYLLVNSLELAESRCELTLWTKPA